jgi:hypothetical protein
MPSMLSYSSSFTYAPISAIYPHQAEMSAENVLLRVQESEQYPYLLDIDHDIAVHLRVLILVESAIC